MLRLWLQGTILSGFVLLPSLATAQVPATVPAAPSDGHTEQAPAPNAERARELFQEGVKLSEQERWLDAEQAFARSAELVPSAACLLNLAVTRFKLKTPLEGLAAIDRIEALKLPATPEQVERASAVRKHLEQEVATMRLQLKPRDAVASLDGKELPPSAAGTSLRLNPGQHLVLARAPGYLDANVTVELGEGERRTLELVLAPSPAAVAPPMLAGPRVAALPDAPRKDAPPAESRSLFSKPWFWIGAGALLAAGVVVTALAVSSDPAPTTGSERRAF